VLLCNTRAAIDPTSIACRTSAISAFPGRDQRVHRLRPIFFAIRYQH
jgi:hypothetical protein